MSRRDDRENDRRRPRADDVVDDDESESDIRANNKKRRTGKDTYLWVPREKLAEMARRDKATGRKMFEIQGDMPLDSNWISEETAAKQIPSGEDAGAARRPQNSVPRRPSRLQQAPRQEMGGESSQFRFGGRFPQAQTPSGTQQDLGGQRAQSGSTQPDKPQSRFSRASGLHSGGFRGVQGREPGSEASRYSGAQRGTSQHQHPQPDIPQVNAHQLFGRRRTDPVEEEIHVTGNSKRQHTNSDIFQFVPSEAVATSIRHDAATGRHVLEFRGNVPSTGNWISEDTAKEQYVVAEAAGSLGKAVEVLQTAADRLTDGQKLFYTYWVGEDKDRVTQSLPSGNRVHIEHDQVLPENGEQVQDAPGFRSFQHHGAQLNPSESGRNRRNAHPARPNHRSRAQQRATVRGRPSYARVKKGGRENGTWEG